MKTKQINALFALAFIFINNALIAQITTVIQNLNCNSSACSHFYYTPGTLISPQNPALPVNLSGTSQEDFVATHGVQLLPGFKASAYSGSGYFHAYSDLSGYDVLMEPQDGQVPEFEKLEFSIKPPSSVQSLINNAIQNTGTQAQRINPCNPDSMSVEATFTSPSHVTKVVYGFYSEDFIYTGAVTDPATRWSSLNNDYKFKVRFAPDETGLWTCSIAMRYPTGAAQNYTFGDITFNCVASGNKGYITAGNNGYLKFSKTNETFFPIGAYLGWANYRYDNTGYNPFAQNPQTLRPVEYNDYFSYLETIKNSGGNYVRVMITSISWGLEWESVGKYYTRLPQAWELDRVIEYCEQNGIYVSLSMTHTGDFIDWDIGNTNETTVGHSGPVWDENPYKKFLKQLPNNYQEPIDPTLFITEPAAVTQYKKFVRYLISRWSYSTHVAKIELMNEGNQIGHSFQYVSSTLSYGYTPYGKTADANFNIPGSYQYRPSSGWVSPVTQNSFPRDLGLWNIDIASYIKNTLKAKQLITCSNAIGPWDLEPFDDPTFSSSLINTISHHHALDNLNCNIQRKDMIDRYKSAYGNKPFIYEEIYPSSGNIPYPGNSNVYASPAIENDAEFHNAAWATCFSGAAGTTPLLFPAADVISYPGYWGPVVTAILTGQLKTKQFYMDNIPALSSFMNGVDLEGQNYVAISDPDVNSITWQSEIEKFYLVSSTQAMGWVHLKRWYWATADDPITNSCRDDNGNTWAQTAGPLLEDTYHGILPSAQNSAVMDIPLGPSGTVYDVVWYDTRTGAPLSGTGGPFTAFGGFFPHLQVPIPPLSIPLNCPTCHPDLAFKIFRDGDDFRMAKIDTTQHFGILPNPGSGLYVIQMKQAVSEAEVEVFDIIGNSVYRKKYSGMQNGQLDITSLSNGIYYVKITNGSDLNETHKIIKQ